VERIDTFIYEDENGDQEIKYCFDVIPRNDSFIINLLWFEDDNGEVNWDISDKVLVAAREAAKEWAEENFDVDAYYEEYQLHGIENV